MISCQMISSVVERSDWLQLKVIVMSGIKFNALEQSGEMYSYS